MKLRNKKTGEILYGILGSYPVSGDATIEYMDENAESGYSVYARYKTLAELNEEWEDYKPVEPLIKDEKIRKAVRAWAEANGFNTARYSSVNDCFCHQGNMMFVEPSYELEQLDSLGYKTIDELCGEEEE